jgi:DNA-binding MurR/RpiR family transcriptional regulator
MERSGRVARPRTIGCVSVAEKIRATGGQLSGAELRVAEIVLAQPQLVAFGTVASLASASGSGAATVVRLAAKLGFSGFTDLQSEVQSELATKLRPAAERIKEPSSPLADLVDRVSLVESANVHDSLDGVDRGDFSRVVEVLATGERRIVVLSGEASRGIALHFASELGQLRDGVELLDGNPIVVGRRLALADAHDVVVAIDLRRYDAWVIEAARRAGASGAEVVAVTDSRLSPLATNALAAFVVSASAVGPFDSYVGALALLSAITAGVADRLRLTATARLERFEQVWSDAGAFDPARE